MIFYKVMVIPGPDGDRDPKIAELLNYNWCLWEVDYDIIIADNDEHAQAILEERIKTRAYPRSAQISHNSGPYWGPRYWIQDEDYMGFRKPAYL